MELLLILDRSGSIGSSMAALIDFAGHLVADFVIGPALTRVGLVQFNGDAEKLVALSSIPSEIEGAISAGGPAGGMTSISDGIDQAVGLLSAARAACR